MSIKTFKQILRFPMKKEGDPKGFIPLRESDLCKQSPSGVRTKRGWLMLLSQPLVFGGSRGSRTPDPLLVRQTL